MSFEYFSGGGAGPSGSSNSGGGSSSSAVTPAAQQTTDNSLVYVQGVGWQPASGTQAAAKQQAAQDAYKASTAGSSVSGPGQWRETPDQAMSDAASATSPTPVQKGVQDLNAVQAAGDASKIPAAQTNLANQQWSKYFGDVALQNVVSGEPGTDATGQSWYNRFNPLYTPGEIKAKGFTVTTSSVPAEAPQASDDLDENGLYHMDLPVMGQSGPVDSSSGLTARQQQILDYVNQVSATPTGPKSAEAQAPFISQTLGFDVSVGEIYEAVNAENAILLAERAMSKQPKAASSNKASGDTSGGVDLPSSLPGIDIGEMAVDSSGKAIPGLYQDVKYAKEVIDPLTGQPFTKLPQADIDRFISEGFLKETGKDKYAYVPSKITRTLMDEGQVEAGGTMSVDASGAVLFVQPTKKSTLTLEFAPGTSQAEVDKIAFQAGFNVPAPPPTIETVHTGWEAVKDSALALAGDYKSITQGLDVAGKQLMSEAQNVDVSLRATFGAQVGVPVELAALPVATLLSEPETARGGAEWIIQHPVESTVMTFEIALPIVGFAGLLPVAAGATAVERIASATGTMAVVGGAVGTIEQGLIEAFSGRLISDPMKSVERVAVSGATGMAQGVVIGAAFGTGVEIIAGGAGVLSKMLGTTKVELPSDVTARVMNPDASLQGTTMQKLSFGASPSTASDEAILKAFQRAPTFYELTSGSSAKVITSYPFGISRTTLVPLGEVGDDVLSGFKELKPFGRAVTMPEVVDITSLGADTSGASLTNLGVRGARPELPFDTSQMLLNGMDDVTSPTLMRSIDLSGKAFDAKFFPLEATGDITHIGYFQGRGNLAGAKAVTYFEPEGTFIDPATGYGQKAIKFTQQFVSGDEAGAAFGNLRLTEDIVPGIRVIQHASIYETGAGRIGSISGKTTVVTPELLGFPADDALAVAKENFLLTPEGAIKKTPMSKTLQDALDAAAPQPTTTPKVASLDVSEGGGGGTSVKESVANLQQRYRDAAAYQIADYGSAVGVELSRQAENMFKGEVITQASRLDVRGAVLAELNVKPVEVQQVSEGQVVELDKFHEGTAVNYRHDLNFAVVERELPGVMEGQAAVEFEKLVPGGMVDTQKATLDRIMQGDRIIEPIPAQAYAQLTAQLTAEAMTERLVTTSITDIVTGSTGPVVPVLPVIPILPVIVFPGGGDAPGIGSFEKAIQQLGFMESSRYQPDLFSKLFDIEMPEVDIPDVFTGGLRPIPRSRRRRRK